MHVNNLWAAHELEHTGHYYVINIKTKSHICSHTINCATYVHAYSSHGNRNYVSHSAKLLPQYNKYLHAFNVYSLHILLNVYYFNTLHM